MIQRNADRHVWATEMLPFIKKKHAIHWLAEYNMYSSSYISNNNPLLYAITLTMSLYVTVTVLLPVSLLLLLTCGLLSQRAAEDIESIVHGFKLHGVQRVWWQGVDRAHHWVTTELSKDGILWGVLGRRCDLVGAGTGGALPLHCHALRCDRKHWNCDVWRKERRKKKLWI